MMICAALQYTMQAQRLTWYSRSHEQGMSCRDREIAARSRGRPTGLLLQMRAGPLPATHIIVRAARAARMHGYIGACKIRTPRFAIGLQEDFC